MAEKFLGSLDELRTRLANAGVTGTWSESSGKHTFRGPGNGILNWWPSTGSVQFQGPGDAVKPIAAALHTEAQTAPVSAGRSRQIFIVHGHDQEARDQLELALHRLNLEPYVLMNNSSGGKTLIEALEGKIGKDYSADFGIVLMTPDDFGYSKKESADKAQPRARQNVILETGMLLSSLTRERMTIIGKGYMELPSDLQGIIRLSYTTHVREVVPKLCQRLKEAGFDLEPGEIALASQ